MLLLLSGTAEGKATCAPPFPRSRGILLPPLSLEDSTAPLRQGSREQ